MDNALADPQDCDSGLFASNYVAYLDYAMGEVNLHK